MRAQRAGGRFASACTAVCPIAKLPCRERKTKTIMHDGHSNKNYKMREKISCLKEWPVTQQVGEFTAKVTETVTSQQALE